MARFTRRARVRTARDYTAAFESGSRLRARLFDVVVGKSFSGSPRLGLAVSRNTAPSAVERNRLKRHIRESFRAHAGSLPAADIVVLPRKEAAGSRATELRRELEQLWERIEQ